MAKTTIAQRDELIELELRGIKETIGRIETKLDEVTGDLGTVRLEELKSIRAEMGDVKSQLAVLQYQAKRSGAFAGAWISAVISVVVGAVAALVMHKS